MATAKRKEKKPIKARASNRYLTNLKQSILETFNIYGWKIERYGYKAQMSRNGQAKAMLSSDTKT